MMKWIVRIRYLKRGERGSKRTEERNVMNINRMIVPIEKVDDFRKKYKSLRDMGAVIEWDFQRHEHVLVLPKISNKDIAKLSLQDYGIEIRKTIEEAKQVQKK